MKRITDINELKQGDLIVNFDGERVNYFEFLMVHPNNPEYVLLIDSNSQNALKHYIPNIVDDENWQIDYKFIDILKKVRTYYRNCLNNINKSIEINEQSAYMCPIDLYEEIFKSN